MYILRVRLEHIRAIHSLEIDFGSVDSCAGWHVFIGDNGSGKSTLIRSLALALALAGPKEAPALRQNWNDWLAANENTGEIAIDVHRHADWDKISKRGKANQEPLLMCQLRFKRQNHSTELTSNIDTKGHDPGRYLWGPAEGWFSSAYGALQAAIKTGSGSISPIPAWHRIFRLLVKTWP
jgi:recombinational DNA repair ATPase RecF